MFKTPGNTFAERARYWVKIINEARAYPAGVSAYCRAKDISDGCYYQWFKKLRDDHPEWKDDLLPPHSKKSKIAAYRSAKQPEIEVLEKPQRRKFSAKYKAKILKEVEAASKGERAAILRREGLYASHLHKWKQEVAEGSLEAKKRGPKVNPYAEENRKLRAQNEKLEKKLLQANKIIEVQKKISEILGIDLDPNNEI